VRWNNFFHIVCWIIYLDGISAMIFILYQSKNKIDDKLKQHFPNILINCQFIYKKPDFSSYFQKNDAINSKMGFHKTPPHPSNTYFTISILFHIVQKIKITNYIFSDFSNTFSKKVLMWNNIRNWKNNKKRQSPSCDFRVA